MARQATQQHSSKARISALRQAVDQERQQFSIMIWSQSCCLQDFSMGFFNHGLQDFSIMFLVLLLLKWPPQMFDRLLFRLAITPFWWPTSLAMPRTITRSACVERTGVLATSVADVAGATSADVAGLSTCALPCWCVNLLLHCLLQSATWLGTV